MVCPYSLSRPGGVQAQAIDLTRTLDRKGHQVTLFAPLDDAADAPAGVDLVATGHSLALPANGSVAPVSVSPFAIARSRQRLISMGFDVVHVHEPFTPGLGYGLLVGRGVPPMVATFHRSGPSVFYRALRPLVVRTSARLVQRAAVSEAAARTATNAMGGQYEVLFNAIDLAPYDELPPWPRQAPTVLFLGRHEERKGLGVALAAFEALRARWPGEAGAPPEFWVAGDGPQTVDLMKEAGKVEGVHFLGVISEDEKVRRLLAADLLVAPSLHGESFGIILLEAMAAGTPILASDLDGYRAAAGGLATLVPPGDADRWSRAMEARLVPADSVGPKAPAPEGGEHVQGTLWRSAARERASAWSMDALADRYVTLYGKAMVAR